MSDLVGFTCAYTPLPLIDALGLVPYRVLPDEASAEQAGTLLHDNLCPHVKRVLDRVLADRLPPLAGVVVMQSCDAMRRLADAWRAARPTARLIEVDLPIQANDRAVRYFALRLEEVARGRRASGRAHERLPRHRHRQPLVRRRARRRRRARARLGRGADRRPQPRGHPARAA
jgi:hypothetical protein